MPAFRGAMAALALILLCGVSSSVGAEKGSAIIPRTWWQDYMRQHDCPTALVPPTDGMDGGVPSYPFSTYAGKQGCCLLDRAIGAMELLQDLHNCTEFNQNMTTKRPAASAPPSAVHTRGTVWEELPTTM
jgi:hypothetical protein